MTGDIQGSTSIPTPRTAARAALQRPPLRSTQQAALDFRQHRDEPAVAFQTLQVLHTIATGKVQRDQRPDHLHVEPALFAGRPNMTADRRRQSARPDQIQVQRKTPQRRHPALRSFRFVLERKHSLCHAQITPLVLVESLQTQPNSRILQGQRRTSFMEWPAPPAGSELWCRCI